MLHKFVFPDAFNITVNEKDAYTPAVAIADV